MSSRSMSRVPSAALLLLLNLCLLGAQGQDLVRQVTQSVSCPEVERADSGDTVFVTYVGKLVSDGKQFDASLEKPISFTLGQGKVIAGWDQGLVGTCKGEALKLVIPANLAYGEKGTGGGAIPPNADLEFELTLVDLKKEVKVTVTKEASCSADQKSRDKDKVKFNYVGKLADGTVFDSTYTEGKSPLDAEIGTSGIKGWDIALTGACPGEQRTVVVPAEFAYKETGVEGLIPANATLILEIELLEIRDRVLGFLDRFSSGRFSG